MPKGVSKPNAIAPSIWKRTISALPGVPLAVWAANEIAASRSDGEGIGGFMGVCPPVPLEKLPRFGGKRS